MTWKIASIAAAALAAGAVGPAAAETPLERGTYLMTSIVACGNCHTVQTPNGPLPGRELAGGSEIPDEGMIARMPNITPDKATGIGNWTDAQIVAAIREGRRPDGSIIGPPMPIGQYRAMSDADAAAIVAYLRQVPPVANTVAKSDYKFPLPPSYGPPVGSVTAPDRADKVAYGRYLTTALGHCIECHSPMGPQGPEVATKPFQGGAVFKGPWGASVAPPLTAKHLGTWSDDEIKRAITTGVSRDGRHLTPPMGFGYYKSIAAADLDAIVAFLRTLPAQ
jgi:mono/diheme cytochrome c family protein